MIDAQKLLDQFLGTGHGRPGGTPGYGGGRTPSSNPLGGGLGGLVGQVLGGSSGRGGSGGGIGGLVGQVLGGSRGGSGGLGGSLGGGLAGKAIGGALAGGLASQILRGKATRGLGGSALKLGGLALVAGLGYKAWTNYQAQQQAAAGGQLAGPTGSALPRPIAAGEIPEAAGTPFHPAAHEADARARLLLSAMIAAAKADGHIDAAEQERIFGKIDDLDLESDEKGLLMDEMRRPLSIDDLVAGVTSPEVGVEVYTASVLAIDADQPAERAYLDMLAARLNLPAELVAEIRRTADEATAG
ncbi:tellurite resistance TerB family protein [Aureimonas pseudogalii]|uniref:Uncharacterized membrane protein YebE (DUF533 family) n=1 Tax=Aureimonas pseudogalii TaxID=1744844 RepID=A0A7W6MLM8_9HYPH|nr:tellurite resistance TerB family protein [Aureimonas pseudogalii]MBB3999940.1 uncharacterized membrane protein YebE (DUF533 family) [Aureimonas pseudogalii]